MDFEDLEPREIELAAVDPQQTPTKVGGFSWTAFGGGLAALVWLAGAIGAPVSLYGVEGLATLNPALQAGLVALAFGPAVLFWLSASAVGEAVKARRMAAEISRLARDAVITPTFEGETQAQRLTQTVKTEIESLNDAVNSALNRLTELESAAQRNAVMFSQALAETRESAADLVGDLAREREAFLALSDELKGQTHDFANSVGRQVRLMREASKLVKTEMSSAEDALENHLHAFQASAQVMAQRTAAFHEAAEEAHAASHNLDATMGGVLDGLSEATKLTDAARRAAEDATVAANTTANAVRETTQHAVFEAKRAAQFIRAETVALQDAAVTTLAKLREAAIEARAASEDAQAAADRHAASIEKRLGALAMTATHKKAAPAAERVVERTIERTMERPLERTIERTMERPIERVANEAFSDATLYAAAEAAQSRRAERVVERQVERKAAGSRFAGFKGFASWSNFGPADDEQSFEAANADDNMDAFALADFGTPAADPDAALKSEAIELVCAAGVSLDATLDAQALEAIAHRSRLGATARRRAVAEAAPVAVSRIARYVKRNDDAKVVANDFRARPDLTKTEGKGSDLVRAYLLIDAALA